MKQITLHDGRVVHIVKTPEEVEELKRSKSDQNFSWHFHGSAEHVEALKKAHEHHSSRAEEFREKHPEIHQEIDNIRHEMDKVAHELEKLTHNPVELEVNFDRFGYSAHIKTHPMDQRSDIESMVDGAIASGMPSLRKEDHKTPHKRSTTMPLYKKPVLRQYFHNGVLYRAKHAEEVASFELFVDLLYVGIIAFNGDKATEEPTGTGLLRFCVTMIPWKIWTDLGTLVSQFETNDVMQRTFVLLILACLVGFTTNIAAAFDTTYAQLIAFYVTARILASAMLLWFAYILPHVRPVMILSFVTNLVPTFLWLGSIWVNEPQKQGLIWLAIPLDLFGNFFAVFLIRGSGIISESFHQRMLQVFSYYPAVNIEHKTERMGAFVSLVFGYSVVSLLYQNQAHFGMNAFFGKAILGLIQAYCFNWMYFDIDNSHHHVHAIRRHILSSMLWATAHLPFLMSFTISGAALSRLVVAHDCINSDPNSLTPLYQAKSEAELPDGLRWFYCSGLGIALLCMTLISATHVHTPLSTQRLRKRTRLSFRAAIAIIWICLPLAKDMSSLSLIGTTTSLTVLALGVDIYGQSCRYGSFLGKGLERIYDRMSLSRTTSRMTTSDGADTMAEKEGVAHFLARA